MYACYIHVNQTFIHVEYDVFVPLHFPFEVSDAQRSHHIVKVNQVVVVSNRYLDLYQFQITNTNTNTKE